MQNRSDEVNAKLATLRAGLMEADAGGVRLRGTDWFTWITAGASPTVLLTAETGVAEILVTLESAWVLTDEIEARRLEEEELPSNFDLLVTPWAQPQEREARVRDMTDGAIVLSDRPQAGEAPLPHGWRRQRRILLDSEIERYRLVGRLAGEAMTEVLSRAEPGWKEYQLAGAGAEALWARGLEPALTLAAGANRLPRYRHPTPTRERLGNQAMLVFCARKFGLFANLTRFVSFGPLSDAAAERHRHVREIEAAALQACNPGKRLDEIYRTLDHAYQTHGYPDAIREHHQGGLTGYLSREVIATPDTTDPLTEGMAVAWNPSVPGAKIEDTILITPDGELENLTYDPAWPHTTTQGRPRPLPLER
ncbi:MAG: M24 family metallopeptidase [Pseudomonadota bacterium]|uniref:M24 family metallopeptidase n=1 Tax=Thermithiobacillus tepidarius TaxID=929 RepID=UPI00040EE77E|nr:M24 family metallopeptidase [Thermithiobacillus tepidarius]